MFHAVVAALINAQFVEQAESRAPLQVLARTAGTQENSVQNVQFAVKQSTTQLHQNFARNADRSIR